MGEQESRNILWMCLQWRGGAGARGCWLFLPRVLVSNGQVWPLEERDGSGWTAAGLAQGV